jgi:MoaA/NifB/PqqE/SkfB family radical SAM enzyme
MSKTQETKSGLFIRKDDPLGLLSYSPFTGLLYATYNMDATKVTSWLQGKVPSPPAEQYKLALGPGWAITFDKAKFPIPHLLSSTAGSWPLVPVPASPVIINWLLTGKCPLKCIYCYAEDLMRGRIPEPDSPKKIINIAKAILSYSPLAVVLTGGDPVSSPFLETAIKSLTGHAGIIIDTSGYALDATMVRLLRDSKAFLRISFDSELPSINASLRPTPVSTEVPSLDKALDAIKICLNEGIQFSVQTVVSRRNYNDLQSLGDKLFKIGIRGWRLLLAVPSSLNKKSFSSLVGDHRSQNRLSEYIISELYSLYESYWKDSMTFQVVISGAANSVVLVAPDGTFYTESNIPHEGKVILDRDSPFRPTISNIFSKVNMHLHTERYLNIVRHSKESIA